MPLPQAYILVYGHQFPRSFSLKPLGQSKPIYVEPPWEWGKQIHEYIHVNGPGDVTKMATKSIYGKIFKIFLLKN